MIFLPLNVLSVRLVSDEVVTSLTTHQDLSRQPAVLDS